MFKQILYLLQIYLHFKIFVNDQYCVSKWPEICYFLKTDIESTTKRILDIYTRKSSDIFHVCRSLKNFRKKILPRREIVVLNSLMIYEGQIKNRLRKKRLKSKNGPKKFTFFVLICPFEARSSYSSKQFLGQRKTLHSTH